MDGDESDRSDESLPENFEDMFSTSFGTPISVEPAPIPEEDEENRPETPSLTPSGRPMSLQPHEELSFDFKDGAAEVEPILGQMNLGSIVDDEFDPDSDESVDRIIEGNRKRWSKPPAHSDQLSTPPNRLNEEAQQ